MNFTCCATCGAEEISEDRDEDTRGYVFFHEQDLEGVAVGGGELSLVFGSFSKSDKRNRAVGEIIARSLRRAGVKVEWEGEAGKRIRVVCGEWRRRTGEEEEVEDVGDVDFDSECVSSGESESEMESDGIDDHEVEELELEAMME
jgi:Fe-S oxidoreductase